MARDKKSKSIVLKVHLAKATIYTWFTDLKKKKADQHSLTEKKNMSNAIVHTHNIQRKAEWKTIHKQSIGHYQTIKREREMGKDLVRYSFVFK